MDSNVNFEMPDYEPGELVMVKAGYTRAGIAGPGVVVKRRKGGESHSPEFLQYDVLFEDEVIMMYEYEFVKFKS